MMMHDEIRIFPDPFLKNRVSEIENIPSNINEITAKMLKIMEEADGIGLAANQIGYSLRLFVARLPEDKEPLIVINPVILEVDGEDRMEEGCLSVPGVSIEIPRPTRVFLKGINTDGKEVEYELEGLMARVVQHEIDHLNGVLIVDYLSRRDFIRFQREYEKLLKKEEE